MINSIEGSPQSSAGPSASLKTLSQVNDWRGATKFFLVVMGLTASLGFGFIAQSNFGSPYFWLVSIFCSVWVQHGAAEEIHDGVHQRIFRKTAANEFMSKLYSALIGISFSEFRKEHLAHHRFFGSPADPDYPKYYARPEGLGAWAGYLLRNFSGYAVLKRLLRKQIGENTKENTGIFSQYPFGTAVVQCILIILGWLFVGPLWYFVAWLVPLVSVTYGLTQFRTLLEHWSSDFWFDPKTGERRVGALYNLTGSIQRNFIGGQFGYNFHGSHHLHASVPNYNLQQISEMDLLYGNKAPMRTMSYFARAVEVFRK